MNDKVTDVFKDELNLISSKQLKDFVIECYEYCPSTYWTIATSTTGKYHPSFVNGTGGLLVHVKYVVWWAQKLIRAFPNLHPTASDEIICALLLHDIYKNGKATIKDRPTNITKTHGVHFAMEIAENRKEKLTEEQERILAALAGHMGVWTEPISFACWNLRDEKTRNVAMIVHLADYCAAQKVDDFIKLIKVPEKKENRQTLDKTFSLDSNPYMLASILLELVDVRQPNYYKRYTKTADGKEYFIQKEAYHFDLLIRKDGKKIEEILRVLEWSQKDSFWQKNIKSGSKFREQYDKLLEQMGEVDKVEDIYPDITKKLIEQYSYLINNKEFIPTDVQQVKFVKASIKLSEFYEKRYKDVEKSQRIMLLIGCLQKNFIDSGRILHPGNMCSNEVWETLLPQFLLELGVG